MNNKDYILISIAKDYSLTPGPRWIKEGDYSGENFRKTILNPRFHVALQQGKKIKIDLDGTAGYGASFLEEVFGGLAREFPKINILDFIEIKSNEEEYLIQEIQEYIKDAVAK